MVLLTERTTFSLDVLGRYTANSWQEVIDSGDKTLDPHARPFDIFVLGGGTFGCAVAATYDYERAPADILARARAASRICATTAFPSRRRRSSSCALTRRWCRC